MKPPCKYKQTIELVFASLGVLPVKEYIFHPTRKWRFDFAVPAYRMAVEIDGGVYIGGRHTRGRGFENDCEKINEAIINGWMVLRFTSSMMRDENALISTLERALLAAKFWPHIIYPEDSDCWVWTGATTGGNNGGEYGVMRCFDQKNRYAHRVSLLIHGFSLDDRLTVDHLCKNKLCVRPDHLEQVGRGENARRALYNELCKRGHKKIRLSNGSAWCPECQRDRRAKVKEGY
jgi:hypothetical protein